MISCLEVNFKTAKQMHLPIDEFLLHRVKDMGLLDNIDL
jgi:hypothetical protein